MKVAFIGLGIMGSRMAARLIAPEIDLTVFNRNRKKADLLQAMGASVADNIEHAVKEADIVFTMLSNPQAVDEVRKEAFSFIPDSAIWVDCSTVSPTDVRCFLEKASSKGLAYLEAPVAGTKQPAENGELVFFVGGEKTDLDKVEPLLQKMGKKIIHMGTHGNAAAIKLLVNLMLAQSTLAYAEAVKLGTSLGLDKELTQNVLLNTPVTAPFLQMLRAKLDNEDTSPNFPLELMHKDLGLVQQMTDELGISLPSASLAKELYAQTLELGKSREDFSSIFHTINK